MMYTVIIVFEAEGFSPNGFGTKSCTVSNSMLNQDDLTQLAGKYQKEDLPRLALQVKCLPAVR